MRPRYKDRAILLPRDAERQAEYSMLAENKSTFLRADVLKVRHHGSKNSTVPGVSGCGRSADCHHFRGRGKSLRPFESEITRTVARKRFESPTHGSGWRGAGSHGWPRCAGESLRGLPRACRGIRKSAAAREPPGQSAITKSQKPPGTHDSSCTVARRNRR